MRENRCASACPTVVLDLTCVRGTQGEREWGGACAGTQAVSLTCRSLHRQRELAVGYVCSGGLEDLRNGGGGWNLGTTSAAWLLPLQALALSFIPAGPCVSLRRGSCALQDGRNGEGGWNLGTDVGGAALALGGASAVSFTYRGGSQC